VSIMRSMGIRGRLALAGILELIGVIVMSLIALHTMREEMIADRVTKVKNLTELSLGIIQSQYDRFQRGEVSEDQAKKTALDTIRPLTYDGGGYVFIDDWDCKSILLPIKPDLEGRDFTDVKDSKGDYFVRNQRDMALTGGGAVYYSFYKPKSEIAYAKVAYVLPFKPWRWFVATGVYLDDVDMEVRRMLGRFLEMLVPAVMLVSLLFFLISRSISLPLRQLIAVMVKLAHGEYDTPIPATTRKDEIGDITQAVQIFRENGLANAEMQKEIQRSNQELENFAYVASHDLREPLRTVTSFSSLLERSLGDKLTAEQADFIGYVRDGTKRMNQLILDLLEVSRIGRNHEVKEGVDLHAATEEAIGNLQVAIQESGATVMLPPSMPLVLCNYREMVRVFQNLIANAIKYSDPARPPLISLSAQKTDGGWQIEVLDNGIGIPPEHSERIFQIFQRLHGRKDYGGGTGIGLAVCKKVIEHHGGRIWVEPGPDGIGSRFIFTLKTP